MTTYIYFIVLGLLQGLTEFLPVSSSGHLVLFSYIFGIEDSLFVSIVLHLATLLSVCVVMHKDIWNLIRHPFSKEMRNLVISTLVTLLIVFLLYDVAKSTYSSSFLPLFFMITAVVLILTDIFSPKNAQTEMSKKTSVFMGIAQGLAVFPGISRSGSTICAGMLARGDKKKVASHSFLMSLPIIVASMVKEIVDLCSLSCGLQVPTFPLILGAVVAFVVGVLTLKFMIKITCKVKFRYFGYYLIVLGIITLFI